MVHDLPSNGTLTVFYDGACPICEREISFYRTMRGAELINWCDIQAATSNNPSEGLSRVAALKRFHVKTSEGNLLSGAAAFAHLWSSLPGWRPLGMTVGNPLLLPFAELAYRFFLVVRPALQALMRKADDGQPFSSK